MKVTLKELPKSLALTLDSGVIARAIGDLPMLSVLEEGVAGEATAELDLYIEGDNVFLRGDLKGWIRVPCSRCVEPFPLKFEEKLAVTYLPSGALPAEDDDEIDAEELAKEEEDLYAFDGETIDLEPLFRERLVLAVPYAPLCSESCRGLCAQCGANLNEKECGCDRQVVDPRLAALKDFKV
jgi:uncharacterized protein